LAVVKFVLSIQTLVVKHHLYDRKESFLINIKKSFFSVSCRYSYNLSRFNIIVIVEIIQLKDHVVADVVAVSDVSDTFSLLYGILDILKRIVINQHFIALPVIKSSVPFIHKD